MNRMNKLRRMKLGVICLSVSLVLGQTMSVCTPATQIVDDVAEKIITEETIEENIAEDEAEDLNMQDVAAEDVEVEEPSEEMSDSVATDSEEILSAEGDVFSYGPIENMPSFTLTTETGATEYSAPNGGKLLIEPLTFNADNTVKTMRVTMNNIQGKNGTYAKIGSMNAYGNTQVDLVLVGTNKLASLDHWDFISARDNAKITFSGSGSLFCETAQNRVGDRVSDFQYSDNAQIIIPASMNSRITGVKEGYSGTGQDWKDIVEVYGKVVSMQANGSFGTDLHVMPGGSLEIKAPSNGYFTCWLPRNMIADGPLILDSKNTYYFADNASYDPVNKKIQPYGRYNFSADNTGTPATGPGYSWDKATKTLTLTNADIKQPMYSGDEDRPIVELPAGSTVNLVGDNKITLPKSQSCTAVKVLGDVKFTGTGSLTIHVEGNFIGDQIDLNDDSQNAPAIYSYEGDIVFEDTHVKIETDLVRGGLNSIESEGGAIHVKNSTIESNAFDALFSTSKTWQGPYGNQKYVGGDVIVDNSTVVVDREDRDYIGAISGAINAAGHVEIKDSYIEGENVALLVGASDGLVMENTTIVAGYENEEDSKAVGQLFDIHKGTNFKNCDIIANTDVAVLIRNNYSSDPNGALVMDHCTVTTNGNNVGWIENLGPVEIRDSQIDMSAGGYFYVTGDMKIEGSEISSNAATDANINMTEGTLTIIDSDLKLDSSVAGITAKEDVTITGSTIELPQKGFDMATGNLKLQDTEVNSGENAVSMVKDGDVTITGNKAVDLGMLNVGGNVNTDGYAGTLNMLQWEHDSFNAVIHGTYRVTETMETIMDSLKVLPNATLEICEGVGVMVTGSITNQGTIINDGYLYLAQDWIDIPALHMKGNGIVRVMADNGSYTTYRNDGTVMNDLPQKTIDFTKPAQEGGYKEDAKTETDGYSYNPNTGTVSIKDTVQHVPDPSQKYLMVFGEEDLVINVDGVNDFFGVNAGFKAGGNIRVTGKGILKIDVNHDAFNCKQLSIDEDVQVIIKGKNTVITAEKMTVNGALDVTVDSADAIDAITVPANQVIIGTNSMITYPVNDGVKGKKVSVEKLYAITVPTSQYYEVKTSHAKQLLKKEVTFTVALKDEYLVKDGTLLVKANEQALKPDAKGVYHVTVEGEVVVTVDGQFYVKPTPTPSPSVNPNDGTMPVNKVVLKKGKTYKVGNYKYKITKLATNGKGTVSYVGASKKTLKSVTIAATVKIGGVKFQVTGVGAKAFSGMKKLKTVTIKTTKLTKKTVARNAFKGCNVKATIKVPKKKLTSYKKLFGTKGLSKKCKIVKFGK